VLRIGAPGIQIADEVRQRILAVVPGLVFAGSPRQTGGVARKLAERDAADVAAALKLGHVICDGIIEAEFAAVDRLGQQCRGEKLSDRREIEDVVGRSPPAGFAIGEAEIEERSASLITDHNGHARAVGDPRLHVSGDQVLQLGIRLRGRTDAGVGENEH
jgi:hypothetical protein